MIELNFSSLSKEFSSSKIRAYNSIELDDEKIKLINSNKVGKPNFAKFVYERWRDGRLKRLNKYPLKMEHPMLWEQSIHHFDLIRYFFH